MRLLLDTHTLLWFQADDPQLSPHAKAAIEDPANERWLSPISLLEIALQKSTRQAAAPRSVREGPPLSIDPRGG